MACSPLVPRHCLKETLAIASDADLNKLTASALVLLAQIYIALGTRKVTTRCAPTQDMYHFCAGS